MPRVSGVMLLALGAVAGLAAAKPIQGVKASETCTYSTTSAGTLVPACTTMTTEVEVTVSATLNSTSSTHTASVPSDSSTSTLPPSIPSTQATSLPTGSPVSSVPQTTADGISTSTSVSKYSTITPPEVSQNTTDGTTTTTLVLTSTIIPSATKNTPSAHSTSKTQIPSEPIVTVWMTVDEVGKSTVTVTTTIKPKSTKTMTSTRTRSVEVVTVTTTTTEQPKSTQNTAAPPASSASSSKSLSTTSTDTSDHPQGTTGPKPSQFCSKFPHHSGCPGYPEPVASAPTSTSTSLGVPQSPPQSSSKAVITGPLPVTDTAAYTVDLPSSSSSTLILGTGSNSVGNGTYSAPNTYPTTFSGEPSGHITAEQTTDQALPTHDPITVG